MNSRCFWLLEYGYYCTEGSTLARRARMQTGHCLIRGTWHGCSATSERYFRSVHKPEGLMSMKQLAGSQLANRNTHFHVINTWKFKRSHFHVICKLKISLLDCSKLLSPHKACSLQLILIPKYSFQTGTIQWSPIAYIIKITVSDLKISKSD